MKPGLPRAPGVARWLRRLVAAGLLLTIVALPALLAGARVDAPARPGEIDALAAALRGPGGTGPAGSEVARQFFLAAIVPEPPALPPSGEPLAAFVARARLVQVLFVFAASGLVYIATAFARGRAQALVACACLALLPPVAAEGHVLRPETPATVFALLALVLLQVLSRDIHRPLSQHRWRRRSVVLADVAVAAVALGLAVAAFPPRGSAMLLPGVVMCLAALQIAARALPLRRRFGLFGLPMRAMNRRLWPWTAAALATPAVGLLLLVHTVHVPVDALPATRSDVSLWPDELLLRIPLQALFVVGAVAGLLRVGLRLGRHARVGPELVLFCYCGIQLAAAAGAPAGADGLQAAPALAVAVGEGVFAAGRVLAWRLLRRRPGVISRRA